MQLSSFLRGDDTYEKRESNPNKRQMKRKENITKKNLLIFCGSVINSRLTKHSKGMKNT